MEKGNRGGRKYSFDLSLSRAPALLPFAPPAVRENGVDIICIKRIFRNVMICQILTVQTSRQAKLYNL